MFQGHAIQFRGIDSRPVVPVEDRDVRASQESTASGQVSSSATTDPLSDVLSNEHPVCCKKRRIDFVAPLQQEQPDDAIAASIPSSASPLSTQATSVPSATDPGEQILADKPLLDLKCTKATPGKLIGGINYGAPLFPQPAATVGAIIQLQLKESWEFASEALSKRKINDTAMLVFNLFALEAYHIAERLGIPCSAASPYLIPYAPPAGFERTFRRRWPKLHTALQDSLAPQVGWAEVEHWMWPLFDDARWGDFRERTLQLPRRLWTNVRLPQAPPLLYGFSEAVVPCPGYWPRTVRACGFWPPPQSWDDYLQEQTPKSLHEFLAASRDVARPLVYIGFGAVGSMGLLPPAEPLILSLLSALEAADFSGILVTSGSASLETELWARRDRGQGSVGADTAQNGSQEAGDTDDLKAGVLLPGGRLLCLRGPVSHRWLLPQCAVALHHAGSGTTAAAIRAGIPQVTCPFLFDQFYWAGLLASLGCSPPPLTSPELVAGGAAGVSRSVATLRAAVELRPAAQRLAREVQNEDGIALADSGI
ncbi:UDP-Glycosyltransferase superfamily protein [Klebsormidium nitens]|uniref:UDP-Glycosyltransferase superfamily protein n=1 Tax=Klebsormidium nitens TaxID=105231 RepID=A0A1Y1IEF8_KLENI|nr:UDP-Glycosyltransferase superfamily protein [Klebsormidium nitens]|eukprot:GAQ87097.1 UDP-Glycosyltransferase superfamily protein [Klebsormidium nitens]